MIETTPISNYSILIVEDDERLSKLICDYLQRHSFDCQQEYRGDTAVDAILENNPELVILDLMLPGIDGFEVCRRVRHQYSGAIMMLTAQEEDVDQIVGLEIGADDYVTKPVEPRVLLARVRSLLRRSASASTKVGVEADSNELTSNWLKICDSSREVKVEGESLNLTTSEFDLLWYLAKHAGKVISRDDLYKSLSGIEYDGIDRAMDIRISRLRKLINDDADQPSRIKTVRSKGYLFVLDQESK